MWNKPDSFSSRGARSVTSWNVLPRKAWGNWNEWKNFANWENGGIVRWTEQNIAFGLLSVVSARKDALLRSAEVSASSQGWQRYILMSSIWMTKTSVHADTRADIWRSLYSFPLIW